MPVSGVNQFHPPGPLHIFLHGLCYSWFFILTSDNYQLQLGIVRGSVEKPAIARTIPCYSTCSPRHSKTFFTDCPQKSGALPMTHHISLMTHHISFDPVLSAVTQIIDFKRIHRRLHLTHLLKNQYIFSNIQKQLNTVILQ